ncbi:hypothetical protein FDP41_000215 [Naegleria fowleri]|uniref:Mevalonate kinase n=1 Tax=Naegleria fowleri TaxID=5763 RepID=A0A6A5CBT2_NAEFO|nr:uncharacterized protein FDP41_000215 [Naegleria fowleri]KAF0985176.1 hypothetical protein FDP41_000215 [Naegleria fowleri]CAG4710034.1 unnamed protein product [Naegleria fowleri]
MNLNDHKPPSSFHSPIHTKIVCSAPGKLILFGEHAVVYGKNAIATSLSDLRTSITLELLKVAESSSNNNIHTKPPSLIFNAPSIGFQEELVIPLESIHQLIPPTTIVSSTATSTTVLPDKPDRGMVDKLVEFTKQCIQTSSITTSVAAMEYNKMISIVSVLYVYLLLLLLQDDTRMRFLNSPKDYSIRIDLSSTNLPIGAGLGSSASFSVCLVSAFLLLFKKISVSSIQYHNSDKKQEKNTVELELINKWAYFVEQLIHGTPSGIDNSVSTFGGILSFSKGKVQEHLSPQMLPNMRILIVNTRVERNTKLIVAGVRERREKDFESIENRLNEIQQISQDYLELLKKNYQQNTSECSFSTELRDKMEQFIDRNHVLLNEIGTGHPKLDKICEIASKYGLHAKLTGAGGGGCGFILLPNPPMDEVEELLKSDLEKEGFEYFMSNQVAGVGVRCDEYYEEE